MIRSAYVVGSSAVSYADYCRALNVIAHPEREVAFGLPAPLLKFIDSIKSDLTDIANRIGTPLKDLVKALANRNVFALLRALRFSFAGILKGMHDLSRLLPRGLLAMCQDIAKSPLMDKLRRGTATVDDFLNRYPIIKKLAGPVLAAFLLWVWLNMSFTGSPLDDFDLMSIAHAMVGRYTLTDFVTSPQALAMFMLLGTGFMGIGVDWFASSVENLLFGLCLTGARFARDTKLFSELKAKVPLHKL